MTLELLQRIVAGEEEGAKVAELIGMRMVAAERGRVTFELDAGPQHSSPPGTLHGGILCDLADAAMGCATLSLLDEGETFATVELKINFLKPVWEGRLTAVGVVIKAGRTLTLCECRVTDEGGSLVAYATSTQMTLRGPVAEGR
ncbi:MAG TPA: PaaI family thioesterase [Gaiellaceae bacterium]|nr:PaaI family thioesterase [Gaiellaceae bacterium]